MLGQEAAWAIRTYAETRPDDVSMEEASDELKAMRDEIATYAESPRDADSDALKDRLQEIAAGIEALSGAPVTDSPASRAAALIDGTRKGFERADEALTVGGSAAD